jgi:undecaprenyl-diphosphatase
VRDALLIGALQGISVVPGISRLGMIMAGAGICGFARKYLVKYAFLLSIPTIVGGVIVELRADGLSVFRTAGAGPCIIGILTSALVGCFVLEFAKNFLSRKRNRGFACYCLAAGILTVVIYLI